MGYETRFYVVEKTNIVDEGKRFAQLFAMFNLCKVYRVSEKTQTYPPTDVYIYADDGNTHIVEDRYGDPLKEIPIDDAIKILEDAIQYDDYRRYTPVIQFLKSIDVSRWKDIVVLHYGY